MFFSNLISVVGKKSPVISSSLIVLMLGVLAIFAFTSCEKEEEAHDSGSNVLVERTFPSNGSIAPHMERPFSIIFLKKKVSVDSLKREVKFLITDEKSNLQSYIADYGKEETTTEVRIFSDSFVKNKKYFVTLRSTTLFYRYGFTVK